MPDSQQYVLPTYARFPITLTKGEGSFVWDSEGHKYLDFCSGIAVCSLGHAHPELVAAISAQAAELIHCSNLYHIPKQQQLAKLIVTRCVQQPGQVFFSNSGAEANEGLIKSARRYGHKRPAADGQARTHIISFSYSFHGRTMGSLSATGQDKIKHGFTPQLEGFSHVEFNNIEAVKAAITPHTVAIMLEVIQAEGGVNVAKSEFLCELQKLAKQHDLLLLVDEVQTGFGRMGNIMGYKAICPELRVDGISWAKGMGGGVPIGAFYLAESSNAGHELSSIMDAGSHGSTYGGNPLVCAASLAVINTILQQNLAQNAASLGDYLQQNLQNDMPSGINEIRGMGLLIGLGLNTEHPLFAEHREAPAPYLVGLLQKQGLLAVAAGPFTLRLLPPLNVTREQIDMALCIIKKLLA